MEKILKDRLNHLKSLLADEERAKLTKIKNFYKITNLSIRIEEVEFLLNKIKNEEI